jgi:hypothetical protein
MNVKIDYYNIVYIALFSFKVRIFIDKLQWSDQDTVLNGLCTKRNDKILLMFQCGIAIGHLGI